MSIQYTVGMEHRVPVIHIQRQASMPDPSTSGPSADALVAELGSKDGKHTSRKCVLAGTVVGKPKVRCTPGHAHSRCSRR